MREERGEVGSRQRCRRALVPADELDAAEVRPGGEEEEVERGGVARVDGERGDAREGVAEAEGEEAGVDSGGGGGAEERVTPRREEGEVEVRDMREGGRDEVQVTRVAAERERGPRLALQAEEAAAHEGERVPRARVGDRREHLVQDLLRQVGHGGGVSHSPVRQFEFELEFIF